MKIFDIYRNQRDYILSIDEIKINYERRRQPTAIANNYERQLLSSQLGGFNWCATQIALWLSATVSHLQDCKANGTVQDLLNTNRIMRIAKANARVGLIFRVAIKNPTIISFTDASWASRRDG